jgi:hypothetical protein
MRKLLPILFLTGAISIVHAQEDALLERATSLMMENDNEQRTIDLQETINDLLLHPINLNTSSEQQLLDCGLFSSYQVYGIQRHKEEFGSFFSIYELTAIPGIHKDFLEDIYSLVSFSETEIIDKQKRNKGMFMTNIYNKFPESAAYYDPDSSVSAYPGSPYKINSRFKYTLGDKIIFGAAWEKDAGENAFQGRKPEHLTGYVKYAPGKYLRNITMGNFKVHTGMGLVHGLGFSSGGNGVQLNGFRTAYSKPFASTAEYDYYRGVLVEIGIKKWTCTSFYSCKPEDISLFRMNDSTEIYNLIEAKRETGMHRTETELNGRDLANQHTASISLNRSHQHLNFGISASGTILEGTEALLDSIPFIANAKNHSWNLSAYALAYGEKYEVYGELAVNEILSQALILGAKVEVNPALAFYASFRNYHPQYRAQIPGAYAIGSRVANETGLNTGLLIIPFNNAKITVDSDICYFPAASYYLSTPGFSYRSKVEFSYRFYNGPEIIVRYTNRSRQVDDMQLSPGPENTTLQIKNQWRIHYTYLITEQLKLGGRMEWTVSGKNDYGSLIYQQIQIKHNERISLTYRILLFDIDSWLNKIYCYEPGVRYSFLFPAYYGKGLKNSLVLSVKFSRLLTLRARLGHIHYANKWETGSGVDIRDGDQTLEAEFQLQLSF